MLFNSYSFVFLFVPVVVAGFYLLGVRGRRHALVGWLLVAAVVFYASGAARHLPLLVLSILFNHAVAGRIAAAPAGGARRWLALGVMVDLGALAFFKYSPLLQGVHASGDANAVPNLDLPVGISFYTFTQISYLVDLYRRTVRRHRLGEYAAFVGYFPHLVAGPVLHHNDVLPKFAAPDFGVFNARMFTTGLVLFGFGLAKKVLLADSVAPMADGVFRAASQGVDVSVAEAWIGILAYALQIYFDFSGYSDMARGISRMLGIELPINFDSPYRATSLSDFWRRWHITLSRFLRNYLYIPLGGNRRGVARTSGNLVITMTLGGLWHGAGPGFLLWGAFHGIALAINHRWREFAKSRSWSTPVFVGWLLTMFVVLTGWVFFRAGSLDTARAMLGGMFGLHGLDLPAAASRIARWLPPSVTRFEGTFPHGVIASPGGTTLLLGALILLALQPFNTNRLVERLDAGGEGLAVRWQTAIVAAGAMCLVLALASLGHVSPFLYYQF
jgi:alginate O-acetyltransferase complex protein AlgI